MYSLGWRVFRDHVGGAVPADRRRRSVVVGVLVAVVVAVVLVTLGLVAGWPELRDGADAVGVALLALGLGVFGAACVPLRPSTADGTRLYWGAVSTAPDSSERYFRRGAAPTIDPADRDDVLRDAVAIRAALVPEVYRGLLVVVAVVLAFTGVVLWAGSSFLFLWVAGLTVVRTVHQPRPSRQGRARPGLGRAAARRTGADRGTLRAPRPSRHPLGLEAQPSRRRSVAAGVPTRVGDVPAGRPRGGVSGTCTPCVRHRSRVHRPRRRGDDRARGRRPLDRARRTRRGGRHRAAVARRRVGRLRVLSAWRRRSSPARRSTAGRSDPTPRARCGGPSSGTSVPDPRPSRPRTARPSSSTRHCSAAG